MGRCNVVLSPEIREWLDDLGRLVPYGGMVFTSLFGLWQWTKNQRNEKVISVANRRSRGPHLVKGPIAYWIRDGNGGRFKISSADTDPVFWNYDVSDDDRVVLEFENHGVKVTEVEGSMINGEGAFHCKNEIIEVGIADPPAGFTYTYKKELHGQPMEFRIDYIDNQGFKAFQVYRTWHGQHRFERIDPS